MKNNLGRFIGYILISQINHNSDKQLEGLELGKIFIEKISIQDISRPKLEEMISFSKKGDTIFVHSMDRLARNMDDFYNIINNLVSKGVAVKFVKERLTFSLDDSSIASLPLLAMRAFSEFERILIEQKRCEKIALAKSRGAYQGRKRELSAETVAIIKKSIEKGQKKSDLARKFGISRETLYRYLDENYREARKVTKSR